MSIGSDLREGRQLGVRSAAAYGSPSSTRSTQTAIRQSSAASTARNGVYTPCGVFHKAAMTHAEFEAWLNDPARPW